MLAKVVVAIVFAFEIVFVIVIFFCKLGLHLHRDRVPGIKLNVIRSRFCIWIRFHRQEFAKVEQKSHFCTGIDLPQFQFLCLLCFAFERIFDF